MDANRQIEQEVGGASKPRKLRKGFKVGCLSLVGLFLAVGLAGIGWIFYITREVPVYDEDLVVSFENIPEEENGYFVLEDVLHSITNNEIDLSTFSYNNGVPETGVAEISRFKEKHSEVLESFYTASGYPRFQYPIDETIPLFEQELPPVIDFYRLSGLSLCNIEWLIQQARHEEALVRLAAHLQLEQKIQNDTHHLVFGMIGFAIHNHALDQLIDYLSAGIFSAAHRPVLEKLHVGIRDGSDWQQMMKAEYSSFKSICDYVSPDVGQVTDEHWCEFDVDGMYNSFFCRVFGRSLILLFNESRMLAFAGRYYRSCLARYENPHENQIDPEVMFNLRNVFVSPVGYMILAIGLPSIKGIPQIVNEQKAKAELVGLYLSVWEYYEACCVLPESLAQLVPKYLPELPIDPYGKGGRLFVCSGKKRNL